jgi:hypothetical protein
MDCRVGNWLAALVSLSVSEIGRNVTTLRRIFERGYTVAYVEYYYTTRRASVPEGLTSLARGLLMLSLYSIIIRCPLSWQDVDGTEIDAALQNSRRLLLTQCITSNTFRVDNVCERDIGFHIVITVCISYGPEDRELHLEAPSQLHNTADGFRKQGKLRSS